MFDPEVALSVAMANAPGRYAILAGSGISRSAQIPTGAEVLDELVRQVAAARHATIAGQPILWYRENVGGDPTYSSVLEGLSSTAAGRADVLRPFFEASPEDIAQGRKVPTLAHHAVGRLAASGHVSLILTTNFDRLFEDALGAAGVVPSVVRGHRDITGMRPLGLDVCTLIKLHGDYRDTGTLNTPGELAAYRPALARLLRRVFTEYGLLIVGWSAEIDIALPAAMRSAPRRYPWYFASHRSPRPAAAQLIADCDMALIHTGGADELLPGIERSVDAIRRLERNPLTPALVADSLKATVLDPTKQVTATDLVEREYAALVARMPRLASGISAPPETVTIDTFSEALTDYDAASEALTHLGAVLGAWGGPGYRGLVADVLRGLIVAAPTAVSGIINFILMQRWPAYRFMYAAGAGAARRRNDAMFPAIWQAITVESQGLRRRIRAGDALSEDLAVQIQKARGERMHQYFPTQVIVAVSVRDAVRAVCLNDADFQDAVDMFEYVFLLFDIDAHREAPLDGRFGPTVRFRRGPFAARDLGWQQVDGVNHTRWWRQFTAELASEGDNWPMLGAGAFDGDASRGRAAIDTADHVLLNG
jgi:hypothetical protein